MFMAQYKVTIFANSTESIFVILDIPQDILFKNEFA